MRTLDNCRKYSPAARVFYISLVFSNDHRVLSQCNARLRLLYLLNILQNCKGRIPFRGLANVLKTSEVLTQFRVTTEYWWLFNKGLIVNFANHSFEVETHSFKSLLSNIFKSTMLQICNTFWLCGGQNLNWKDNAGSDHHLVSKFSTDRKNRANH